jgi:putative hydrolase of the HAD superfamily
MSAVRALLLDLGGVILTKGWGHISRQKAAKKFGYDYEESTERHEFALPIYEVGDLTLDEYLDMTVFYCKRDFTRDEYKAFMFTESEPLPEMLHLFSSLKTKYGLKAVMVSNEGRELQLHRIHKFDLESIFDIFVVSSFVGLRKPDPAIYRIALDQMLVPNEEVVYVDDTPVLAEVGRKLGIPTILHTGYESTVNALADMGLSLH